MRIIPDAADWAGEMPAVLVADGPDMRARRARLADLAARVLGCGPAEVAISHRDGHAPVLVAPGGVALHLSSASRAGVAALAVGRAPLGIDVEAVEPGLEPPWQVLHPAERAWLLCLPAGDRPNGFAGLWAAKEAYLKALGTGFVREPASFAIRIDAAGGAQVADPAGRGGVVVLITTAWIKRPGRDFALALAQLAPGAGQDPVIPG